MNFDLIAYIITFFGLIFVTFCFILIFLGKKIGDPKTGKEKIKIGENIELDTSSVITLTIIMIFFTLAPLILLFYKPELSSKYISTDKLELGIRGTVVYENKRIAEGVIIDIIREIKDNSNSKIDTLKNQAVTDQNGWYDLNLKIRKGERVTILYRKENYAAKRLIYDYNNFSYSVELLKTSD